MIRANRAPGGASFVDLGSVGLMTSVDDPSLLRFCRGLEVDTSSGGDLLQAARARAIAASRAKFCFMLGL